MGYSEDNSTYPYSVHGVKPSPFVSCSLEAELSAETSVPWFLFLAMDMNSSATSFLELSQTLAHFPLW